MERSEVQKALEQLKQQKKRNFSQSYDLIINLKNINPKTASLDFFIPLPYPKPQKPKIAAFVDRELAEPAQKFCDLVIKEADFPNYDKKAQKKLAKNYDYFLAQANLMTKVGQFFGKTLAPQGKMPNPKLGLVVPPTANLEPLIKKLQSTVRLSNKKATNLQCFIGKENQPDDQLIDNVLAVFQAVLKQLPEEKYNLKNVQLKLTMGKPLKIMI